VSKKIIKIGGASGFWGDSALGAPQLVAAGIDYLVFDYLAELTMSILVNARAKDEALGYATDFVDVAMKTVLQDVACKGIKVVSNAGGVNPRACAAALQKLCEQQGVVLKIAIVEGDDVLGRIPALREAGVKEMFSGVALPEKILSANAYLGAIPIAAALKRGADVVITGRCVDSAVTLGPLIHEFDWVFDTSDANELSKLAQGALAGHIIECGAQATGGLFTDWESVPDWANIGYPIVECHADGSFVVTKPAGTGGLVTPAVVAEQMLYEIGDPAAYILPDVVCDFTEVVMTQEGDASAHRVRVQGARGGPPTDCYKVSATYMDGWRAQATLLITGIDAAKKAQRSGEAILERTRGIFKRLKFADYLDTQLEIIGAEHQYGAHARTAATREAVMRLAVRHENPKALGVFAREVAPAGTSWSPGTTGMGGGRGKPAPNVRMFSFLLPKSAVRPRVELNGEGTHTPIPAEGRLQDPPVPTISSTQSPNPLVGAGAVADVDSILVPLLRIAHARSGDKGNISNIGVIARDEKYLPLLRAQLTPAAVKQYFAHLVKGEVVRYELPGIHAFNFVLHEALDGGGMASLRADPLGKGMAQMLLDMPVAVPRALLSGNA
jgi:Acyclic terpene utilisation family protein AtuA